MFLDLFDENKKSLFLDLAYCLASADGDFGDQEEKTIKGYQYEMRTDYNPTIQLKNTEDVISDLSLNCSDKEKKIIVFEVIGLALVDGKYDQAEKSIVSSLAEKFGIDDNYLLECEKVIKDYLIFQDKINKLVIG